MAFRFGDNFESGVTADLPDRGWSLATVASTPHVLAGAGRGGTASLRITGQSNPRNVTKTLDAQTTWIVGFAFKMSALDTRVIVQLLDAGTAQCSLLLNLDGTLSVVRGIVTALTSGTSTLAMTAGNWYFIEWKCTIADSIGAGTCKVRVSGVDWITVATGQDTKSSTNATANQITIGPNGTTTANFDFDDIYLCDGTGSTNNDFLGDCVPATLRPTGAGTTTGWTPSTGSNYQNVDDTAPNDDTDYNSTITLNAIDTFAMADLTATPSSIFAVNACIEVRKADAGSRNVAIVLRSGGTDYVGSTQPVLDDYSIVSQVWETDPATGVAWTAAGINALQVGYKLIS